MKGFLEGDTGDMRGGSEKVERVQTVEELHVLIIIKGGAHAQRGAEGGWRMSASDGRKSRDKNAYDWNNHLYES